MNHVFTRESVRVPGSRLPLDYLIVFFLLNCARSRWASHSF